MRNLAFNQPSFPSSLSISHMNTNYIGYLISMVSVGHKNSNNVVIPPDIHLALLRVFLPVSLELSLF
jgi:hypothetical protein